MPMDSGLGNGSAGPGLAAPGPSKLAMTRLATVSGASAG
jgi:hypothetical protein